MVIVVFTERPSCSIFAHVIKEHVYSIGASFLQSFIERLHGFVVIGSIKTKLFKIFHLCISAGKPWGGGGEKTEGGEEEREDEGKEVPANPWEEGEEKETLAEKNG